MVPREGEVHRAVDDEILDMAVDLGVPVITNDAALVVRLRGEGIKVIRLRGGDHLDFDGGT